MANNWPAGCGISTDYSQEKMELSRTISHLASANQQLAIAHNVALSHLEALYTELKKEIRPKPEADTPNNEEMLYKTKQCSNYRQEQYGERNAETGRSLIVPIITDHEGQPVIVRRNKESSERRRARLSIGKQPVIVKSLNKKLKKSVIRVSEYDDPKEEEIERIFKFDDAKNEIRSLTELQQEIENLKEDRSESQLINARLRSDLEAQKKAIERLKEDCEVSRTHYERAESSLVERTNQLDQLSRQLKSSERETARLLTELETFQFQKTSAETRISNLEKDLRELRLEKERMKREEDEKSASLKVRLTEESSKRKRQLQELEEARREIQTLKDAIEMEKDVTNSSRETGLKATEPAESTNTETCSIEASSVNEDFKRELLLKREARQRAIAAVSSEMDRLRRELDAEKVAHSETSKMLELLKEAQTRPTAVSSSQTSESKTHSKERDVKTDECNAEWMEALRLTDLIKMSDEVINDLRLQLERTDDLRFHLENDPDAHRLRIAPLKRLADEIRDTLKVRKLQVNHCKDRLAQLQVRLGDKSFLSSLDDIRVECERQIEDITRSRSLSDERARIYTELKETALKELQEVKMKLENAKKSSDSCEEELRTAEDKIHTQDAHILNLESQLGLAKADCRDLQNQMSVINSLFTQMLLGASSAEMDLDRLTRLLQENHDLISDMAKENGTEAAALPKLLLDLIEQVDGRSNDGARDLEERKEDEDLQEENIAHNLPKVWRVLLELLSCHAAGTPAAAASSAPDSCYKSVDTPTGPRLVISVSKTYIRLKELILEKKHLEKEMNRMKQLNTHLESKLGEQEKRLSTVSDELSKTWNIVGRMQAQHQQLHTHEKILRYELQQKRKMLQELKQELEYCREKWESARQKNTNTEIEWRSLRREFAARKAATTHTGSLNNSAESGFSDEREEETDEEDEAEAVGIRVRILGSRRRTRKDDARVSTPDTESEQPTDNELSESKTTSSSPSEHRTPTPEADTEIPNVTETDPVVNTSTPDNSVGSDVEALDPVDRALTNVIRNLIKMDKTTHTSESCSLDDEQNMNVMENERLSPDDIPENDQSSPIFSIGPYLNEINSPANKNVQFSDPLIVGPSKQAEFNFEISSTSTSAVGVTISNAPEEHETIDSEPQKSNPDVESGKVVESEESKDTKTDVAAASTSNRSHAEVLDARAARLKRLEEQAEWLVKRVSATNRRGSVLSTRLEELHETYGSIPIPPPMPDVLPSLRIRTNIDLSDSIRSEENSRGNDKNAL